MKVLRVFLCAAMIMLAAVVTCCNASDNNEGEGEVRKAIETYFKGIKTKNIDLIMSVISPSFLQIIDVGNETGVKIGYDQFLRGHSEFFKDTDILNFNFEIIKIEITDNKATVETNTSLIGKSLKEDKSIDGNKPFIFFLEKTDNKWLIVDKQDWKN